jgi:hypothetical protein
MRLEKEYRYIYGVWQYVERILGELDARLEKIEESGSESDKLVRTYYATLPKAVISADVIYEKKNLPLLSRGFGKIAFTDVRIDVLSNSSEIEKEIIEYFSKRLALYTLRGAG